MDWNSLMSNPQFLMGMGMLSGNYGTNKRQAFANAMGGGLQGLQQAQIASLRAKAEERAQAEEERKQKEYERMVHTANAQRQLAMGKLHQPYEQDLFPGEQPIPGLYGPENPNLSADEKTSYELIAAGYNPAVAGQFANYMGTEGRAAQAHADRMELQRAQDAAAMQRAQIQAGKGSATAGLPRKVTKTDREAAKEILKDYYASETSILSPSTWLDTEADDLLDDSAHMEKVFSRAAKLQTDASKVKGGVALSWEDALVQAWEDLYPKDDKKVEPKATNVPSGWSVQVEP